MRIFAIGAVLVAAVEGTVCRSQADKVYLNMNRWAVNNPADMEDARELVGDLTMVVRGSGGNGCGSNACLASVTLADKFLRQMVPEATLSDISFVIRQLGNPRNCAYIDEISNFILNSRAIDKNYLSKRVSRLHLEN